jgi:hypothetical protein
MMSKVLLVRWRIDKRFNTRLSSGNSLKAFIMNAA